CKEVFNETLGDKPNQIENKREDVDVTAADLLDVKSTPGSMTEQGLRTNVSVGIQYLRAWLEGNGAVAINGLMEDAATAEISRSQVWQWLDAGVTLDSGEKVTKDLVERIVAERARSCPGRTPVGRTPPAPSSRSRSLPTTSTSSPCRPTPACPESKSPGAGTARRRSRPVPARPESSPPGARTGGPASDRRQRCGV